MRPETQERHQKIAMAKERLRQVRQLTGSLKRQLKELKRRKMKPGRGRAKGNANENAVAKMVVRTFGQFGITRKDCYRTPSSGGHRYARKRSPGDLVVSRKLARLFPFEVECKAYKEVDLNPFYDSPKRWKKSWPPRKWLAQTVAACDGHGDKVPLLVMKANQQEPLAALPAVYPLVTVLLPRHKFRYKEEDWYLVRFDRLLSAIVREYERSNPDAR